MKLAMLAPIAWRTPPKHYGPWESIASLLTEGLVSRGVDVTLFATLDSVTAAALDGVCPHGYAEDAQLASGVGPPRRSGGRLVICGIVQDEAYFADAVEPYVDGDQVIFIGSVGPQRRAKSSGMRRRCCTRSISMSPSACRSWRRWRAVPRLSPIGAAPWPRSLTRA